MFKKSRIKIVASIMSILVLLWVGTLAVIYGLSYFNMYRQNTAMLKEHADMYTLSETIRTPPKLPVPDGAKPEYSDSPMFRLSTFYTVAVSYNGEILEIKNGPNPIHTNDELQNLALEIISKQKTSGRKNNLVFYVSDKSGYTLVAFMDNTVINENAMMLFRYTLIFGGSLLIIFFFISVFLARVIVKPLEESYRKQKQFISDAGHELKTPVSVVGTNAELLSREIGENRWLENIQYENNRMAILISQLLELARTETVNLQKEQIDLGNLVSGEALPFESVAFEKNIFISYDIADGISVRGNSGELKQLVSILLDNAVRHGEAGNICVSLAKERSYAVLSVTNKGKAIPEESRKAIFERFYRLDNARNGNDNHYGLGLAIAKSIVHSHKGKIEINCRDSLVTFTVTLPIQQ